MISRRTRLISAQSRTGCRFHCCFPGQPHCAREKVHGVYTPGALKVFLADSPADWPDSWMSSSWAISASLKDSGGHPKVKNSSLVFRMARDTCISVFPRWVTLFDPLGLPDFIAQILLPVQRIQDSGSSGGSSC